VVVETREVGYCGSVFFSVVDDLLLAIQEVDEVIHLQEEIVVCDTLQSGGARMPCDFNSGC
jgi:hypothetical protein